MKLTFITDEASQEPSEFIALAHKHDCDAIELRSVQERHISKFEGDERRELRDRLRGEGLAVCAIDSPVFKSDIDEDHELQYEKLRRSLEAAEYFGAPMVRIFSFWRKDDREQYLERSTDAVRKAADIARPTGIRLVVENGKRTMHATGAELEELMNAVDTDVVRVLWDPGNCIFGRTDMNPVANGYPRIKQWVDHVHVKDPRVHADGDRAYVKLGEGQLAIPTQLQALRDEHYDGYISLETHWRPGRVFKDIELDYPGGESFSDSGYGATDLSMVTMRRFMNG